MIGVGNDCLNPIQVFVDQDKKRSLRVACGHCINCKIARKKEWTIRLQMELLYWKEASFVTLTYDEDHVPVFQDDLIVHTLDSAELTRWIKRFRKQVSEELHKPFSYFAVGEYGTKTQRPHYHIIIFGIDMDNVTRITLDTWRKGFVDVRSVSPETCAYISGYVQKKLYGSDAIDFRNPEFMHCSKHIGERWLISNFNSLDPERPTVSVNGFQYIIPRQLRRLGQDPKWCAKYGFEPWKTLDVDSYVELQQAQLYQLDRFCKSQGTDLPTYFRNREAIAKNHQARVLSSRNTRGV